MQFAKQRVRTLPFLMLSTMLALPGCVSAGRIVAIPSACSALLPQEWQTPVPGAPLPESETVGDWISFGDQQTAQLDKANDRTISAIGIVSRCEVRDAEAVKRARKHLWAIRK